MTELTRSYHEGGLLSTSEIARNEDLPVAYLEQLIGELRRAGLVEGTRGVRGGYRLARGPETITVGDVYRVLEGEVAPVDCTAEDYLPGGCAREPVCLSRGIWARVQSAILGVLDSTTLDDLLVTEGLQRAARFVPLDTSGGPTGSGRPTVKAPGSKGEFAHV
jgi:Rrf2 family protein